MDPSSALLVRVVSYIWTRRLRAGRCVAVLVSYYDHVCRVWLAVDVGYQNYQRCSQGSRAHRQQQLVKVESKVALAAIK